MPGETSAFFVSLKYKKSEMNPRELIDTYRMTHDFTKQAYRLIENPASLTELVDLAVSDLKHPYPEYASWLLVHVAQEKPELVVHFIPSLIDRILVSDSQSVLRNLTNICHKLSLTDYREAEFLDRLIHFIKDDANKPALFVYSLYNLIQFTQKYPELKQEIDEIIALKQSPLKPSIKIAIKKYNLSLKK
jgi:hypothetical protein